MSADPLTEAVIADTQAIRAAGVEEGRAQAVRIYFGQSAIRLTVGLFAAALHEAAAQMGAISPEAAQFFGTQAQLFAEFAVPPQVVSVSPATDAADVAAEDQVVLGFSSPLDPTSVTDACIYVAPTNGGPHLSGDLSYDGANTVTFVPANGFSSGVEYTITVAQNVKSKLGQPMGSDYTSTFTAAV